MSWQEKNNFLEKEFIFKNFLEALTFINMVWDIAEKLWHHPDISLYDYNHIRISTTTHDTWSLSEKDYELIQYIDTIKI
jgi:4a-hydroxytetrahydrobiopterin dehydratase